MPKLIFRLAALLALTALLLAGAATLLSSSAAAQGDSDESSSNVQQNAPQDDDQPASPAFTVNHEAEVETGCAGRNSGAPCESETRYFVFDTPEDYFQFLSERTAWLHSRIDPDASEADLLYWQAYRSDTAQWPLGTLAAGGDPPNVAVTGLSVRIPEGCTHNIFSCRFADYSFNFLDVNQAIVFLEEREAWLDAYAQGDTSVSATWWQNYPRIAPPFLANQAFTVETACDDGRNYRQDCDTETRYFNFHTEAQYFSFLKQRGDWQMRRFDADRDAAAAVTVDYDYYHDFESSHVPFETFALDATVSDTMTLEDVPVSVNSVCNSDRSHCSQLIRYFDFVANEHAVLFAQDRLRWLEGRFNADANAETHWWKQFDWTTAPGEPAALENVRWAVDRRCTHTSCRSDEYYFNFANYNDYLFFLKKQSDWRTFLYDRFARQSPNPDHWKAYAYSEDKFPENTPTEVVREKQVNFSEMRTWVPTDCTSGSGHKLHDLYSCDMQERTFTFNDTEHAVEYMLGRLAWNYAVMDEDASADPTWWETYRSWEWMPAELQGLAVNNIPWCYTVNGHQYCTTITRYFWHDDWRDRGAFQREHQAYRDGTSTDWDFWMDYTWDYDDEDRSDWFEGQNERVSVPLACTGPYSCVHGIRYFHFFSAEERENFYEVHEELQNNGNWLIPYWAFFKSREHPF